MRRFFYLILFILTFWITFKHLRPVHAQTTCASDQTLGWHDCGSASMLNTVCGGQNICSQVYTYSGGIYDTSRNRLLIWGGGHGSGPDNSFYAFGPFTPSGTPIAFLAKAGDNPDPRISCLDVVMTPGENYSCDHGVTQNAGHGYDGYAYIPDIDAMFNIGGHLDFGANGGMSMFLYLFSGDSTSSTPRWKYLNDKVTCAGTCLGVNYQAANPPNGFPDVGFGNGSEVIAKYDPNTHTVWFKSQAQVLWNYNPATNVITNALNNSGSGIGTCYGSYATGALDPVRKKFWLNGCSGLVHAADITSVQTASQGWSWITTTGAAKPDGSSNVGFVYDPVSTHIVMYDSVSLGPVYDYNPDTNTVTATTYSGGPPAPNITGGNGTFGRFQYIPSIDAFVVNNGADRNTWVLRTRSSTPDTTPPTNPSSLTATAVSSSQINLAWTASTDNIAMGGYFVEQCSGGSCSNFAQVGSSVTNSFSNTGLTASTSYSYRVRAFDTSNNLSGYSNTSTTTTLAPDVTPPTAPSSLTATAVSSSQINLSWVASTDNVAVTGYRIERCSGAACGSFAQIAAPAGTGTTYLDLGLTGSTSYSYRVRAIDGSGNMSSYSNTATDTTQAAPPQTTLVDWGSSGGLAGGAEVGTTYGLASWTTPFRDFYSGNVTCPGCGNGGGSTNVNTFNGVYNFQGVQTSTAPRTFVPGEIVSAVWFNNSGSPITFTPLVSFLCASRSIYAGCGPWYSMSSTTIAANSFATSTYTVDGTSTGTYSLVNTSVNFDNTGILIEDKIVLLPSGSADVTAPTNPSSLTATSISQSQINLSWTASTDAVGVTSYLVERCSGGGCSNFTQITTVNGTPPVATLSDTGLATNTSYSYRVRASDGAGNLSGYSNTASATTMTNSDTTPPSAPSGLTVQIISYRQANLSWTASTDNVGVTGYNVEQCLGANCANFTLNGVVNDGPPPSTTFTNYTLGTGLTYSWRITAIDAAGNISAASNVVSATTLNPGPIQVGYDKLYTTLAAGYAAAGVGDSIEIDYNFSLANITQDIGKCLNAIRGVGPPGTRAQFIWDGGSYNATVANGGTGVNPIPNDQGILRIFPSCTAAQPVNLENLEFAGAYGASGNAAGVRVGSNFNINFLNDYFHDNENNVLTGNVPTLTDGSPSTISMDKVILGRSGNGMGAHNLYVGQMGHLIFKNSKSVDSHQGHLLKSRAYVNEIYSSFFSTKDPAYDGSIESDFPCGGDIYYIGNIVEQGTNTGNGAIIDSGEEHGANCGGGYNPTNRLYFVNNTFFNYRTTGTFFQVTSAGGPAFTFVNQNNILANGGTLYNVASPTLASNNNTTATSADFVSSDTGNYRLVSGASEINAGTNPGSANGFSLTPTTIYLDPAMSDVRPVGAPLDIGAYEFNGAPSPGNSGNFSATTNITQSNLTLNWTKGTDAVSPQNTLQYAVYKSTTNNITTVANMLANGTLVFALTTDVATANISALNCGTTTFFNVLIQNQAGTQAAYNGTSQVTLGCNIHAGRGRLKK